LKDPDRRRSLDRIGSVSEDEFHGDQDHHHDSGDQFEFFWNFQQQEYDFQTEEINFQNHKEMLQSSNELFIFIYDKHDGFRTPECAQTSQNSVALL
jgi:hypothetical protein